MAYSCAMPRARSACEPELPRGALRVEHDARATAVVDADHVAGLLDVGLIWIDALEQIEHSSPGLCRMLFELALVHADRCRANASERQAVSDHPYYLSGAPS